MDTKTFKQEYELGFPDIDGPRGVVITFKSDRVEFTFSKFFSAKKIITLYPKDIIEARLNQESYHSVGKTVAGAVIGGALTGGLGLIIGSALGGKRRKENRLHLVVHYMGINCDIFLEPDEDTVDVYTGFKTLEIGAKRNSTNKK